MITVSELYLHPIKSCRGQRLDYAQLDEFGIAGDRRWMIVDEAGEFITQREQAELALIDVAVGADGLVLSVKGESLAVAEPDAGAELKQVRVWRDWLPARDAGDAAALWLSEYLGRPARLVHMPADAQRRVNPDYARQGERVSFADGYPILLISQAGLDDLNARLETPVPMNRFRPNIVVAGTEPFAEDAWQRLRIGAIEMSVVKPCDRCVMPSIDQATGERDRQINRVLASFRRRERVIYFGQNVIHHGTGTVSVGDEVEVLS